MKLNKLIIFCFAIVISLYFSACNSSDLKLSVEGENDEIQDMFTNHSVPDYVYNNSITITIPIETPDTINSDIISETSSEIVDTSINDICEIYPDQLKIAKELIMKAREVYLDLYSFSFEDRISVIELNEEQSNIFSEKINGKNVNYLIDDLRYNTWDTFTDALLKYFTQNAVDVFQTHTVTTFYDINGYVYASHAVAGFEGPDFVKAIDITNVSHEKFVLKSCAYRIAENLDSVSNSYDTYYFDTTFIKEGSDWKIDSSSEDDKLFYMFSYCEDLRF